jgi:hypothetical protein
MFFLAIFPTKGSINSNNSYLKTRKYYEIYHQEKHPKSNRKNTLNNKRKTPFFKFTHKYVVFYVVF